MAGMGMVVGLIGSALSLAMSSGGAQTAAAPPAPPPPPPPPTTEDAKVQQAIDDEQRQRMAADAPTDQNKTKQSLASQDPLAVATNVKKKDTLLGAPVGIPTGGSNVN